MKSILFTRWASKHFRRAAAAKNKGLRPEEMMHPSGRSPSLKSMQLKPHFGSETLARLSLNAQQLQFPHLVLHQNVPENTIYWWSEATRAQVFLRPAGFTGAHSTDFESGSNGLLLDTDGSLILCQHGDRRVARLRSPELGRKGTFENIADNYDGKQFNSPNDIVRHRTGLATANCTLAPDERTLYITADSVVLRLALVGAK